MIVTQVYLSKQVLDGVYEGLKINLRRTKAMKSRRIIYYYQEKLNDYFSTSTLIYFLYGAGWTILNLCIIAEMIRSNSFRFEIGEIIGYFQISLGIAVFESLKEVDADFNYYLYGLNIANLSKFEREKIEQLMLEVDNENIQMKYMNRNEISRKLTNNMLQYGITYSIVYLQMLYIQQ
nr:uncharacterized protein LOC111422719 [Onthophagus taurus]